jgi:hypothetical protein
MAHESEQGVAAGIGQSRAHALGVGGLSRGRPAIHSPPASMALEKIKYFGFVLPNTQLLVDFEDYFNLYDGGRRTSSKARIARLRRSRARRSYRSMASNCLASCDRIVANFCGPSGVEVTNFTRAATGMSGAFHRRRLRMTATFFRTFARES